MQQFNPDSFISAYCSVKSQMWVLSFKTDQPNEKHTKQQSSLCWTIMYQLCLIRIQYSINAKNKFNKWAYYLPFMTSNVQIQKGYMQINKHLLSPFHDLQCPDSKRVYAD